MRSLSIICATLLFIWLMGNSVFAMTEYVTVVKVLRDDDKGIIQRKNGERWLIEKGVGALSFWRYEGKSVLIHSSGLFCGVGSKLILPDDDQEARIWNAERLSDDVRVPVAGKSSVAGADENETIKAVALALVTLKYFDAESNDPAKKDPVRALKQFQVDNKLDDAGRIGPRTLAKLAELILKERGDNAEGLALAQVLIQSARGIKGQPAAGTSIARPSGSASETFITDVSSDGSVVKLTDGSIYEIDALGQIKTMLWLPTQKVLKQADGLLNLNKGQSVKATALK